MIKKLFLYFWELFQILIITLVIVVPIRYFLFQPFVVKGQSMEPSFFDGDYLIIDEISYRFRDPKRGEVIVFKPPYRFYTRYIKRIIGLPGETIEIKDGHVFISGELLDESDYLDLNTKTWGNVHISLKENEYFILGDNRNHSSDSRSWGTLPKKNIVGRVFVRLWPINNLSLFKAPTY